MPHTRKEILEWGREMANKIFHRKKGEVTINGWVARGNSVNCLRLFTRIKPVKHEKAGLWNSDGSIYIPDEMFPSVKWEDDEPTPCEITITIKI